MVTTNVRDNVYHLVGLSSDGFPTEYKGMAIGNGSFLTFMDTNTTYMFDEAGQKWDEFNAGGGGGGTSNVKLIHLYSDGNAIYSDSGMTTVMTYEEVKAKVSNKDNFVTLYNGNWVLYPTYANTTATQEAIWFTATTSLNDVRYFYRIIINSENKVLSEEYPLQDKLTQGDGITIDSNNKISANINNTVTSTSTTDALSANMGKALQDQISNLKNIGRFLSIWDCTTGKPLTEPVEGTPYNYRTGDYYRVSVVGDTNYKPDGATYTGAASTVVETGEVTIGAVYYYDGDSWEMQSSGAGGKVQDVQVNGTTILNLDSGVANITDTLLADVKYTAQSLTDAQKAQARTNVGLSTTTLVFVDATGTETTLNVQTV